MHADESSFVAMILFVGRLEGLVQIVFVDIGNQLVSNRLLNCFADESKILKWGDSLKTVYDPEKAVLKERA